MKARLYLGDCLDLLRSLSDESIDSVVTDPPYGLGKPPKTADVLEAWLAGEKAEVSGGGFMGKEWDSFVPGPRIWREVLRVTKPGGHAIVFAGTRTLDWMTMACRLAGWEVRDTGVFCYYSGFPKSLDVSKAIDRAAGAEREVVGVKHAGIGTGAAYGKIVGERERVQTTEVDITAPATDDAKRWEGWGTALKPAWEPWVVLRKPLEGTVAANVLKWGTGAVNVDGCRFKPGDPMWPGPHEGWSRGGGVRQTGITGSGSGSGAEVYGKRGGERNGWHDDGRWPANLVYVAKPSRSERERGLDRIPGDLKNDHPTVKPVRLMRWLVRLTTPPGGTVLDPFMGSGTTGAAACGQGFDFIGADLSARFVAIAHERIRHSAPGVEIEAPQEAVEILGETDAPTLWDTLGATGRLEGVEAS